MCQLKSTVSNSNYAGNVQNYHIESALDCFICGICTGGVGRGAGYASRQRVTVIAGSNGAMMGIAPC